MPKNPRMLAAMLRKKTKEAIQNETTNLKYMKLKQHLFLLLTAIVMMSCDDNQTDDYRINSYPLTIGSTWAYDRTITDNYYKSLTSDSIVGSDTMVFEGTIWIEKDTTINKSKVLVFKTRENNFERTVATANYHFMDKDGLKLIAYYYGGDMLYGFTKKAFIEPTFQALNNGKMNSQSQINSGVYIISAPILDIKYPLTATSEWTSNYPVKIDKKVIGTDTLHLNGHEYICLKVLWKYPEEFTIKITEWIAKEGILKRVTNFGTMYTKDQQGNNLNKFESTECVTIKSVSIK